MLDIKNAVASQVEELAPGLTFERSHDGQVFVFMFYDLSRKSIDAWIAKIRELTGNWSNERPFMALTQVSGKYLSLTPYLRGRLEELSHWRPDLWSITAVVLPNSFFMQMMLFFIPTLRLRNGISRVFNSRENAFAWLEKELVKTQR